MTKRNWRKIVCRLPALLVALAVLIGAAAPALATEEVSSTGTIWSYLAQQSPDWLGTVIGTFYASACPTSSDNLHHGKILREADKRNEYWALCDYCSKEFPAHASDLDNAYKAHVINIQNNYGTTAVGTKGILYPLTPTGKFVYGNLVSSSSCSADAGFSSAIFKAYTPQTQTITMAPAFISPSASAIISSPGYISGVWECYSPETALRPSNSDAPVSHMSFTYYQADGLSVNYVSFQHGFKAVTPGGQFKQSDPIRIYTAVLPTEGTLFTFYYRAWLQFRPNDYDVNSFTQNIGGENSRIGKFSGNFGYYGDNGQLITADNVSIVNEGDKTFYNPATGQSTPIIDWSYDYGDRSYSLSLEGDLSAKVVFGDENVTIKEGDTTYNIYYITPIPTPEPTPSTTPTPTPSPTSAPVPTPSGNPQPTPTDNPGEEGGGGSLWEKIWDAIAAFFKFIGDLIGRLLLTLLSFFTGILEHVVGLVDLFGTFGEIVSSLYTWLPADLQTLIAGALAISLALAVISLFRK